MSSLLSLRHYSHELLCHSHKHAQLVFGLSGLLEIEVAGRGNRVSRNTLAVVPSGAQHACDSRAGSQCLVLDVGGEQWLQQQLGQHYDATRRLIEQSAALSLSPAQSQLVGWLAASPIHDPIIAQQGAALLLACLTGTSVHHQTHCLPLAALDAHIDQHAAHPLQVADLARLAGLSTARFHVRFLDEVGQTPMAYIRNRRLHMAHQLLLSTTLPVGEIAARVGYNSQSAFTAALSKHLGLSARAIRRNRE